MLLGPRYVPDSTVRRPHTFPDEPTQVKTYGKELANLAKLYTDKSKYSSKNNNFNFKLTIFIDLYQKANISK